MTRNQLKDKGEELAARKSLTQSPHVSKVLALVVLAVLCIAASIGWGCTSSSLPTPPLATVIPLDPCYERNSRVDQVILNTGYDQVAGAPYTAGLTDGYWQLVESFDSALTVPAPAWVISPSSAWATLV